MVNMEEVLTDDRGASRTVAEWARWCNIPLEDIWERVGCWVITAYGLECLTHDYPIPDYKLDHDTGYSWPEHMAEKQWVDLDEFTRAWQRALVLHDKESLRARGGGNYAM